MYVLSDEGIVNYQTYICFFLSLTIFLSQLPKTRETKIEKRERKKKYYSKI